MTDIMEARRKGFEEWVKTFNSMPAAIWKDERGRYIDDWIQCRWLGYNAALDSVCVELPQQHEQPFRDFFGRGINYGIQMCIESIERAGLKVNP